MERAQEVGVVGRRQVDRPRRARLCPDSGAAIEGYARRPWARRPLRQRPLHHEARWGRLALRAQRTSGWSASRALRARGVAGGESALPPAVESRPQVLEDRGQRARPGGRPQLPLYRDDVPAHRALSLRRHEPLESVADRASARALRRDQPGAGPREENRQYRVGQDLDPARQRARQGPGDAADARLHYRRPHRAPHRPAVSLGLPGADHRRCGERAHGTGGRAQRLDPRGEGLRVQRGETLMAEPMGFFTDTTVCSGCKACEVACKEWNQLPARNGGIGTLSGDSYDNTRHLDGIHWRHVKFIEQFSPDRRDGRWLMMSDVCKHCVRAGCMEVCPTGAIIRTEFDTVVIQSDACKGCRRIRSCLRGTSGPPPCGPPWGRLRWRSSASSASANAEPGMSSTFFTASPHWRWLITAYFFLGGLAGGSYFVATLMHLFSKSPDRRMVRLGYLVPFPLVCLCGLLLTVDLGRPERFWHMLIQSESFRPMIKTYSPMSSGAWVLLLFSGFAFLSFLARSEERRVGKERRGQS